MAYTFRTLRENGIPRHRGQDRHCLTPYLKMPDLDTILFGLLPADALRRNGEATVTVLDDLARPA